MFCTTINLFHVAEKWEVHLNLFSRFNEFLSIFSWQNDHYVPVIDDRHVDVRPSHLCASKKKMVLHCIDEHG